MLNIIIPAHSNLELTIKCIEHLKQNTNAAHRIIYVDDGSPSPEQQKIEHELQRVRKYVERGNIIWMNKRAGFTACVNEALKRFPSGHVLLLNNDCFVGPGCIDKMLSHLSKNLNCAAINPLSSDDSLWSLKEPGVQGMTGYHEPPQGWPLDDADWMSQNVCTERGTSSVHMLPFYCTLIREEALRSVGHLDSNYQDGIGVDDAWCRAAKKVGWELLVAHDAYAVHLAHKTFDTLKIDRKSSSKNALQKLNSGFAPHSFTTPRLFLETQSMLYGRRDPDVLYVQGAVWHEHIRMAVDTMEESGIRAAAVSIPVGDPTEILKRIIHETKPRLVVNHGLLTPPAAWEAAAVSINDVRRTLFLATCHSGQTNMLLFPPLTTNHMKHLELVAKHRNCFYADVDERQVWSKIVKPQVSRKCFHLPNPLRLLPQKPRPVRDTYCVSLVCAPRVLKNVPGQILGAALAAKDHELTIMHCYHEPRITECVREVMLLSECCGLDSIMVEWSDDWSRYTKMLESVDIGLQCSYTESFNYVAAEHLLSGCPVVGSPAIRYLPREWQANPDSPEDIARVLKDHILDYEARTAEAIKVGTELSKSNNEKFISVIKTLIS